jgi:PAS domain S-box-containing protein
VAEGRKGAGGASGEIASPLSGVLAALAQAPIGVAIFDREMRYLAASRQFLIDQGLPGDTPLVGRLHYDVFPEIPQRWRDLHAQVLADGRSRSHEADPYLDRHGQHEWIRWSLAPWRDETGAVGGVVLYTEVVTAAVSARLRLEAAESRYRAVFDQAAVGIARISPTGDFLEVNDRFCAITGYGREDVAQLTFEKITHPDDLAGDVAQVRRVLAGEISTYSLEKRYLKKQGGAVWVNLTVTIVRDREGRPDYFVSIIEDIGARKGAEAAQKRQQAQLRLLLNELNHRVKNTLATVQSIAAQTLRAESDPAAAYAKFEARLLSLSQVHEVLTREHWHGAALREVAERALRPFTAVSSGQIGIEGPDVWLPPAAVLTVALVLHELATNAAKYGALTVDQGRVDFRWSFQPEDRRLRLTWTEAGGPPVSPPRRQGFGSRLIERSFRGDLRGTVATRYERRGVTCDMEATLPAPVETADLFGEA